MVTRLSASWVAMLALLWAACGISGQSEEPAISGVVRYEGEIPLRKTADNEGKRRPILVVDRANDGLAYAMVYLVPSETATPPENADSSETVVIQQEDYEFVPRVVGVTAGQKVAVGNRDYANHNVRATADNSENVFNIITPFDGSYERTIQAESSTDPIRLSCDIHAWMSGWIYVFDHPWFSVTTSEGRFRIESIPAGAYTLVVEQPDGKLRAESHIDVKELDAIRANVTFTPEQLGRKSTGTIHIDQE